MIKSHKIIVLSYFVLVVFAGTLSAQSTQCGIGINLIDVLRNNDSYDMLERDITGSIKYPVLYMTILSSSLRLDPEISYWRFSKTMEPEGAKFKSIEKRSIIHFGVGVARILKRRSKNLSYIGLKTVLDFNLYKSESANNKDGINRTLTKRINFLIGPYMGTEYFLTGALSLGGEFQLLYTKVGQRESKYNWRRPDEFPDTSESLLKSKVLVFLRWYF